MRQRSNQAKRQESAPLYFACPYDNRRRFKSIAALNRHIAKVHPGQPFVKIYLRTASLDRVELPARIMLH